MAGSRYIVRHEREREREKGGGRKASLPQRELFKDSLPHKNVVMSPCFPALML
jgi:hypothetical protein